MKKLLISALVALATSGVAYAQSDFYLGVEGGFTFFSDTSDKVAKAYINELGASTVEVEQERVGALIRPFVGFELADDIALELGLSVQSRKTTAEGTFGGGTFKDTFKTSWRILDCSVLLHPNTSGFFARLGGHVTTIDTVFDRDGSGSVADGSYSDTEHNSGLILGFGYDWKIGRGALRASFTHYSNMLGYEDESLNLLKVGYLFKF